MSLDDFYYINIQLNDFEEDIKRKSRTFNPPLDIYESEEGLNIELEVPSYRKDEISVICENNRIKICGNKRDDKKSLNYLLMERDVATFEKVIELPILIDGSRAKAKLKDGVLSILIPF